MNTRLVGQDSFDERADAHLPRAHKVYPITAASREQNFQQRSGCGCCSATSAAAVWSRNGSQTNSIRAVGGDADAEPSVSDDWIARTQKARVQDLSAQARAVGHQPEKISGCEFGEAVLSGEQCGKMGAGFA